MVVEDYVCSLDEITSRRAEKELGENALIRQRELVELHDWVTTHPTLTCSTDPRFLLRYLRTAKFDQQKARERLLNHVGLLSRKRSWFGNVDPLDPAVQAVIDSSHVLYLPGVDDDGQKVILYRLGAFNPDSQEYDKGAIIRTFTALFLDQIHREDIQVNGFVYILDASHFTLRQQFFWNIKDLMLIAKLWQNAMPCRFKGFHFYNIGVMFEVIFKMLMPFLSKKFRERIFIHRSLTGVYDHVPMRLLPLEYLPQGYDGDHGGSIDELIDLTKLQISRPEVRNRLLYETSEDMGVADEVVSD